MPGPNILSDRSGAAQPVPVLPAHAFTALVVEDSRFASDALRLMLQRCGVRMRRAASLADARRHLALYVPHLAIVDIGLPDGSGKTLIAEIAQRGGPPVMAISGEPDQQGAALQAGARLFVAKPFPGLAAFSAALAVCLPSGQASLATDVLALDGGGLARRLDADPLALRDDLAHALALLRVDGDPAGRRYVRRFLGGLARTTCDGPLEDAAATLDAADAQSLADLERLVAHRLHAQPDAFAQREA